MNAFNLGAPATANADPDDDTETFDFFAGRTGALSKTREDATTWFDYLDLIDHVSVGDRP